MHRAKKSTLDISVSKDGRESQLLGESARMMNSAINEAFAEIGVLSQLISHMKKNARKLKRISQELESSGLEDEFRDFFANCSDELIESAGKSQERMQFADRMHHQLFDVQSNLKKLAEISKDREKANAKRISWSGLFGDSKPANESLASEQKS